MPLFKPIAAKGAGEIGVVLPSASLTGRYREFDAAYLYDAFTAAGFPPADLSTVTAQGTASSEYSDAELEIDKGIKVLIVDPLDRSVATRIESYAKARKVTVIDYDRLDLDDKPTYDVGFDYLEAGHLLGLGFVACTRNWHVDKPRALVMQGAPDDAAATLLFQGYWGVLRPHFKSRQFKLAGRPGGTWSPGTARREVEQEYKAHRDINAILMPSDETAAAVIGYLKTKGVKPKSVPVTGQDATLAGLGNILGGYQCGTVYKPIYLEAQTAAVLSLFVRAGLRAPAVLLNGKTKGPAHSEVKSALVAPQWVTRSNMANTVIADNFVIAAQLCAPPYATAQDCRDVGIKP